MPKHREARNLRPWKTIHKGTCQIQFDSVVRALDAPAWSATFDRTARLLGDLEKGLHTKGTILPLPRVDVMHNREHCGAHAV
jgi:hypothetical protein